MTERVLTCEGFRLWLGSGLGFVGLGLGIAGGFGGLGVRAMEPLSNAAKPNPKAQTRDQALNH